MASTTITGFVAWCAFLALVMPAQGTKTPIMGYNSYNQVACSPNASQITNAINAMQSRGFLQAGYKYFQIDCGWSARDGSRNASNGALAVDLDAFPDGLQPLSNLARSKGFLWSMYSDAGVRMCDTTAPSPVLGSLGHELADAQFFKSLSTSYLKCKTCFQSRKDRIANHCLR